jgi:hypothetical protein
MGNLLEFDRAVWPELGNFSVVVFDILLYLLGYVSLVDMIEACPSCSTRQDRVGNIQ